MRYSKTFSHGSLVWMVLVTGASALYGCLDEAHTDPPATDSARDPITAQAAAWHLNDLTANYGAPTPAGKMTGYAFNQEPSQHIIYRDTGNHVHELWNTNHGWNNNDLTTRYGAPTPAGDLTGWTFDEIENGATQHLAYTGIDGHVHELWNAFHGWNNNDLTLATGAPLAYGVPSGYAVENLNENSEHVILRATTNLLYEAGNRGQGWNLNTISANAGAPVAASDPKGFYYDFERSQHAVYSGVDRHVYELWWIGTGWHLNDLTAVTGAPPSDSDLAAYSYVGNLNANEETVVFKAADGHLHQLDNFFTSGWTQFDLTAAAGAPAAVGTPAAYEYNHDVSRHVIYRGSDNHIYEIYNRGFGWFYNDLTTQLGAPMTTTDPIAYDYAEPSQHILYVAANGHVYEMWFK